MVKTFAILLATAVSGWSADPLPPRAQAAVDGFLQKRRTIEDNATRQIQALKENASKELLALHDQLKKAGDLPRAEFVLSQLVIIHTEPKDILKFPTSMSGKAKQAGQQFVVITKANAGGSIWGTDIYTADSSLPAVALHTGAATAGETILALVTAVPGREQYRGTQRNGVKSSEYGKYAISYQLLRIGPVPRQLLPQPNGNEDDAP